jgi:LysM repeat protein
MCGTGSIGQKAFIAPNSTTGSNTQVGGESGAGSTTQTSGGGGDLAAMFKPILEQLTQMVAALQQAISGIGMVADASGEATGGGHGHAGGCSKGGGHDAAVDNAYGGADSLGDIPSGKAAQVGDEHGHGDKDAAQVGSENGGPSGKQAYVGSENGGPSGKGDSKVDSENGGPSGKGDSKVDSENGGPGKDVKQITTPPPVDTSEVDSANDKVEQSGRGVTDAEVKQKEADDGVAKANAALTAADKKVEDARTASIDADKAMVAAAAAVTAARTGNGEHVAGSSDTLASIAEKYGTTVAELKTLNPSITIEGTLAKDTKVKLPKGVGVDALVAAAEAKVTEARAASEAARAALDKAIAEQRAAREAVKAAEAAAEAAKKALEEAKAAAAAKELEAAKAKLSEELKGATDINQRGKILAKYTDMESDPARRKALQQVLLDTLEGEEKTNVTKVFQAFGDTQFTPEFRAREVKLQEELKAKASGTYDEKFAIFTKYADAETVEAYKTTMWFAFVGSLTTDADKARLKTDMDNLAKAAG